MFLVHYIYHHLNKLENQGVIYVLVTRKNAKINNCIHNLLVYDTMYIKVHKFMSFEAEKQLTHNHIITLVFDKLYNLLQSFTFIYFKFIFIKYN